MINILLMSRRMRITILLLFDCLNPNSWNLNQPNQFCFHVILCTHKRHRACNIFARTYYELWLQEENVGQEIMIEDLTVSFRNHQKHFVQWFNFGGVKFLAWFLSNHSRMPRRKRRKRAKKKVNQIHWRNWWQRSVAVLWQNGAERCRRTCCTCPMHK